MHIVPGNVHMALAWHAGLSCCSMFDKRRLTFYMYVGVRTNKQVSR